MPGSTIAVRQVRHWFGLAGPGDARRVSVLDGVSLDVASGEFLAIVGPSGCGKTTVLNMVGGLIDPQHGEVLVNGHRPEIGAPDIGYLFARDGLLPWRTAEANVALPLEIRKAARKDRHRLASQALVAVGLGEFAHAYPAQLSHGMRQRVALARTLVTGPNTLLMDEPFSALDAQTRLALQEQFMRLWQHQSSTVLFVTHDLAEAVALADRLVVFSQRPGRVKAEFPIDLPRPRSVTQLQADASYHRILQQVWDVFKSEVTV